MSDHPILFNAEMVRAILAGTKTQTRRPIKTQPQLVRSYVISGGELHYCYLIDAQRLTGPLPKWHTIKNPFGGPGDRLWVRECWGITAAENRGQFEIYDVLRGEYQLVRRDVALAYHYRASDAYPGMCWRRSVHMPREASRITLEVKRVWVERIQNISRDDALAEGVDLSRELFASINAPDKALRLFPRLWDSIYAAKGFGWDENPQVFAAEFSMIENEKARDA